MNIASPTTPLAQHLADKGWEIVRVEDDRLTALRSITTLMLTAEDDGIWFGQLVWSDYVEPSRLNEVRRVIADAEAGCFGAAHGAPGQVELVRASDDLHQLIFSAEVPWSWVADLAEVGAQISEATS